MSKRTKKINQKCDHYSFYLKPQQNYCKFNQTISVSFCDSSKHRKGKESRQRQEIECLQCPVFNKDKNFATPTFILHSEKQHFEEQGEKMRTQHEKKMIEYTDEKDSLNEPKPRSKNSFCNVCRQIYEDYRQHILSDSHKKCIRNSNFNRFILELVDKFNPRPKPSLNFSQNTLSTQDDEDVEILYCKPKKKVKTIPESVQSHIPPFFSNNIIPPPHLNLNHATYFPHTFQNYFGQPNYNLLYSFNNLPTLQFNFNNQEIPQNQAYHPPNITGFRPLDPWNQYMAQYQRNLLSLQSIGQFNSIIPNNFSQFNALIGNEINYPQQNRSIKLPPFQSINCLPQADWTGQKNQPNPKNKKNNMNIMKET